jgi:hypothetical protein
VPDLSRVTTSAANQLFAKEVFNTPEALRSSGSFQAIATHLSSLRELCVI